MLTRGLRTGGQPGLPVLKNLLRTDKTQETELIFVFKNTIIIPDNKELIRKKS